MTTVKYGVSLLGARSGCNMVFMLQSGFKLCEILTGFCFACYLATSLTSAGRLGYGGNRTCTTCAVRRPRLGQAPSVLISKVSQGTANTKTRALRRTLKLIHGFLCSPFLDCSQVCFWSVERQGSDSKPLFTLVGRRLFLIPRPSLSGIQAKPTPRLLMPPLRIPRQICLCTSTLILLEGEIESDC